MIPLVKVHMFISKGKFILIEMKEIFVLRLNEIVLFALMIRFILLFKQVLGILVEILNVIDVAINFIGVIIMGIVDVFLHATMAFHLDVVFHEFD